MRHLLALAAVATTLLVASCHRPCPPCADGGAPLPVPVCASKDGGCDAG